MQSILYLFILFLFSCNSSVRKPDIDHKPEESTQIENFQIQSSRVEIEFNEQTIVEKNLSDLGLRSSSQDEINIPENVPQDLKVRFFVKNLNLQSQLTSVRAFVSLPEKMYQVESKVEYVETLSDSKELVHLRVQNLHALIPKHDESFFVLSLKLYSKDNLLHELSLKLQTPPSEVKIEELKIEEKKRFKDFFRVSLNEKESVLLRVLRIQNQTKKEITFTYEDLQSVIISQKESYIQSHEKGCEGNGYSVSKEDKKTVYSPHVYFVPLQESYLFHHQKNFESIGELKHTSFSVSSNSEIYIGIYGINTLLDRLISHSPKTNEIQNKTVGVSCPKHCVETRTRSIGGREHQYEIEECVRHHEIAPSSIQVGWFRSPVVLENFDTISIQASFEDSRFLRTIPIQWLHERPELVGQIESI